MQHQSAPLAEMPGMWRRSLIIQADGSNDATSQVRWLQAKTLFVDLRQGIDLANYPQLHCLSDLSFAHLKELARQEGFAGRLGFDGDHFEWLRLIDFQPRSQLADAGRLWWEDEMLVEAGRDVAYVEHWIRDPTVRTHPLAALRLRDVAAGIAGLVVQVGTQFMFARDRQVSLPAGTSLEECIAGAMSLDDARAMLDCEISLGSVGLGAKCGDRGSVILASTHPWRVSECFELACSDSTVTTRDTDPRGNPVARRWEILEIEGDPAAAWPKR